MSVYTPKEEQECFSTLAADSVYWQAEKYERVVNETTVLTHNGIRKYARLLFDFKNCSTNVSMHCRINIGYFKLALGFLLPSWLDFILEDIKRKPGTY